MENERRATENNYQGQADPKHRVDLAMAVPNPGDLGEGCRNHNGGGNKHVVELECREKQDDWQQIEKKFHGRAIIRLQAMAYIRLPIIKPAHLQERIAFRGAV